MAEPQPTTMKPKLRWYQYSLWALLVVVLLAGIVMSWLAQRWDEQARLAEKRAAIIAEEWARRIAKEREPLIKRQEALAPIERLGGSIYDGCGWVHGGVYVEFRGREVTDATLERLKGLMPVDGLGFNYCHVTDSGLEHLKGTSQLIVLHLDRTSITDAGLANLKGLAKLEWLSLNGTSVTDAGLEHLKGLVKLKELDLSNTSVTDTGLDHLKELPQLKRLYLENCHVTEKGERNFERALPKRRIVR